MIKVLIIDDEKDARFLLRNMLERSFADKISVIAEAEDVEPGILAIETHKPDVVFLDVQMRKGTGFDLLQGIGNLDFEVVFITAHNQYAVDAFKFSAFGYLLKPIKLKDITEVIDKLESHLIQQKDSADKRLKVLVENYGADGEIQKLIISNIDGFQVVKIKDILRLEGDRNYTHFITEEGKKITASKSLGEFEELLNNYGFFRIHQSTMVNLRHVTGYQKGDGGSVEMSDGSNQKLSRHRKAEFIKRFI
ncbi:MAG: DNA-binding response regulator [Bacteroidetes bacterium]|jgi:two-component system LytT family response regulator|nr:DNA-binding response regulator [Bacteroidota bacterium]